MKPDQNVPFMSASRSPGWMQRKTHKIKPERTSTREGRTLNIFSINFEFLLTAAENTIEKCPERASELTCTKIIIATRNTGNREVEKKMRTTPTPIIQRALRLCSVQSSTGSLCCCSSTGGEQNCIYDIFAYLLTLINPLASSTLAFLPGRAGF
jgi:hypothetical protein